VQRRDAVVFLENACFSGHLRSIQLDLFRIFLGLNLDETLDGLFHTLGQIGYRLDLFAVYFVTVNQASSS